MASLRPFQRRFLRGAMAPEINTAALSCPRGNGKSWMGGFIAARAMRSVAAHHEIPLFAASIEQARIVFRFARQFLGEEGYRYLDSSTRCGITRADGARLRVVGSNARTSFGLVNSPIAIADEPGAWEVRGGEMLADAIETSQGKPGSPLKVIYIGTLAPSRSGWWHDLIAEGSHGSTYVQALQGDRETWDKWPTIRKANPLVEVSPAFRRTLLEERDKARRDTRLKARFLSYRLNLPTPDESEMLLTVDDWQAVEARPVGLDAGPPIVAVDMGGGRAWSAAVAIWESGRIEALALAPGLPGIEAQEERDRVPSGTYRRLVDSGALSVARGLRVPPAAMLWEAIQREWGQPAAVVCDRFRLADLQDAGAGPLFPRVTRWSEAAEDVRALRRNALDGPLSCAPRSRGLLAASLAAAQVASDDAGNTRLVKRGTNNEARDDVAAALLLAAGEFERRRQRPASPFRFELVG